MGKVQTIRLENFESVGIRKVGWRARLVWINFSPTQQKNNPRLLSVVQALLFCLHKTIAMATAIIIAAKVMTRNATWND